MVREMRSMYESGQLNAVQQQWYQSPGEERLFDLASDPFEVHDVSSKPQYEQALQRMRTEMDDWLVRSETGVRSPNPLWSPESSLEENGRSRPHPRCRWTRVGW